MQNQLPTSWQKVNIGEDVNIVLGGTPSKSNQEYWGGSIKWLTIPDISNAQGRYVYDTSEVITQSGIAHSAAKVMPAGTIIFSARGTVGEMGIFAEPMAFNQSCYGLSVKDDNKIDQMYLYYGLKNSIKSSKNLAHGGVFSTFTKETFNHINIPTPKDIKKQKTIASILSAYDDKIEVNSKIAKTLEEMAQAIFKKWFTNSQGKEYSFSNLATYVNGGAFGKIINNKRQGLPLIKIADLNRGITENTEWIDRKVEDKYYVSDGDLIFSWSGSIKLEIWDKGKAVLNQHLFNVKPGGGFSKGFLYFTLLSRLRYFKQIADSKATTMGHIKKEHIEEQKINISEDNNLTTFDLVYRKLVQLKLENQKLASIRDLLLPKLMKGEIRV